MAPLPPPGGVAPAWRVGTPGKAVAVAERSGVGVSREGVSDGATELEGAGLAEGEGALDGAGVTVGAGWVGGSPGGPMGVANLSVTAAVGVTRASDSPSRPVVSTNAPTSSRLPRN